MFQKFYAAIDWIFYSLEIKPHNKNSNNLGTRARTESINFDSRIFGFAKVNQKSQKDFDFRFKVFIHLFFGSVWFWFVANHDSPGNHVSPVNQNQIESKIKGMWIVIDSFANHWLIRFRIKSESKWIANQAGPNPTLKIYMNFSF